MEEDPTVGVALGSGSDLDVVPDETLLGIYHGRHLQFTQFDGFLHRDLGDSVRMRVGLEALRARARLTKRRSMSTCKKN